MSFHAHGPVRGAVFLVAPLLLVAMPGAPSSVLVPSGDALCYSWRFLLLWRCRVNDISCEDEERDDAARNRNTKH